MRKTMKKTLLTFLTLITMTVIFCFGAGALAESGKCGENVIYTYDITTKELVISGTGAMGSYKDEDDECECYYNYQHCVCYKYFDENYEIKTIVIGSEVTEINLDAFRNNKKIQSIIVDKNNKNYSSDCGILFNKDKSVLIACPPENPKVEYSIPEGTKVIDGGAFTNCKNLKSIIIPDSTIKINGSAFYNCDNLVCVNIGHSVKVIGNNAFCGCDKLNNIIIPESVLKIGDRVFYECSSLSNITVPDSAISVGDEVFKETAWYNKQPDGVVYLNNIACGYKGTAPENTSIVFKDGTKSIAAKILFYYKNVIDVEIPDSVTNVGYMAFHHTTWHKKQPDGLIYIGKILYECKGGADGSIKAGTRVIAEEAFSNCYWLEEVTIPDSVVSIGYKSFHNCGIKSIVIPNSVTMISDEAFAYCRELQDITIGDSVTYIGDSAFSVCLSLDQIIIPDSVTYIDDHAFSSCCNLKSIIIGDSVIHIGENAFCCCDNLKEVTLPGNVISIGEYAFGYREEFDFRTYEEREPDFLICAPKNSLGEKYAIANEFNYKDTNSHNHKYIRKIIESANCENTGTIIYECSCGNKYAETVARLEHNYSQYVYNNDATYISDGTKTAKCKECSRVVTTIAFDTKLNLSTTSKITTSKTSSSVTLKWNKVAGASGYRIFQKVDGKWKTLTDTANLTYTVKSLKANTKYDFAVRAYVLDGKTKVLAPKYKSVSATTVKSAIGTTSKITATKTSSSVTLKWNKVSGATGYRIFQKVNGDWKKLTDTTKLTYTIKKLKANTKYTFAVRAYVTKSGKTTLAPKYKTFAVTTASSSSKPAQVKNVKATPTATTVKLTWSKVSGVKGYEVFSYNAKTKKYTSLGKTTSTSYTVKKLKANTAYQYAVQAYKVSGKKNVYGKVSSVVKVTTLLSTPTLKLTTTKGKANLTWADIKGETGYEIYMATSKNGKYTYLATYKANSTKATKSKLTSGKTYYFKIRAVKKASGKTTYSAYSAVKSVKIK